MKVFIQVVDTKTGIYQCGMIDEPVKKGLEVQNALGHFGVDYSNIEWGFKSDLSMIGKVRDTTKIISIIKI